MNNPVENKTMENKTNIDAAAREYAATPDNFRVVLLKYQIDLDTITNYIKTKSIQMEKESNGFFITPDEIRAARSKSSARLFKPRVTKIPMEMRHPHDTQRNRIDDKVRARVHHSNENTTPLKQHARGGDVKRSISDKAASIRMMAQGYELYRGGYHSDVVKTLHTVAKLPRDDIRRVGIEKYIANKITMEGGDVNENSNTPREIIFNYLKKYPIVPSQEYKQNPLLMYIAAVLHTENENLLITPAVLNSFC